MPNKSHELLEIYDLLGNKIKILVNESKSLGKRIVVWDGISDLGREVTSGVYFYQIHSGILLILVRCYYQSNSATLNNYNK